MKRDSPGGTDPLPSVKLACPAMFEASHTGTAKVPPDAVWELWADPTRWPDWNDQLASGELHGELEVGTEATVKFKRGGKMAFKVVELEPGRLFTDEAKLPGCRFGHEHRVTPTANGSEITHRLYLEGPTSGAFARLLGRGRMRDSVAGFVKREIELTQAGARA
ncbi:MAG: SRPBCC family protein [Actinomycetota bacterium]|nr:SRPBCC family protein [Actinomycetota bacterium]